MPVTELKTLLNLSREQCQKVMGSSLPSVSSALKDDWDRSAAAAALSSGRVLLVEYKTLSSSIVFNNHQYEMTLPFNFELSSS